MQIMSTINPARNAPKLVAKIDNPLEASSAKCSDDIDIDIDVDEIKAKLSQAALNGEKDLVLRFTWDNGKRPSQTVGEVSTANQPQTLLNQLRRRATGSRNCIDTNDIKAQMLHAAWNGKKELVYTHVYDEHYNEWLSSLEKWFINEPECRVPYTPLLNSTHHLEYPS